MQPRHSPNMTKHSPNINIQPTSPKTENRSMIVVPSRVVSRPDEIEDGEETEIAAQITVPQEGGWGWVVVFASFWSIFVLDGVAFTFGSVFNDIIEELKIEASLVALINSIAVAMYFSAGPLTSALINRFGFRAVVMSGAIIVCFALFCTYLSTSYSALCVLYGGVAGLGYCFINMASYLVVGFYFERLRSLALAIATTGSSFGIMVMFPFNTYIVKLSGWRTLTLLHSGLFGIVFFLGMTYKPLISLTVSKTTESNDPTRTVTYLPNVSTQTVKPAPSRVKTEGMMPTVTEKLFSAVSNYNFPTAAAVVEEGVAVPANAQVGVAGPSTSPVSKLTLTAHSPRGGMSQRQIKQVQSIVSKSSVQDRAKKSVEVIVNVEQRKQKSSCWGRMCHWEKHISQSRPMYRDDAFFDGKMERLPVYQKSRMDASPEPKTGLEYQLAVSRAVTTVDLQETKGVFTTAARRILATMMDPKLLKKTSFMMFALSGFLIYLGYLVPYIFLQDRNKEAGVDEFHCSWFVSAIGFSNAIGRLVLGAIACKVSPLKLFISSCLIAGLATILSDLSYDLYYQYFYCFVFGFFIASIACLRSMVLVDLYGLDKLTNATGMMLLFQGFGCIISTPAASMVKDAYGFSVTFYVAGFFIFLSGVCILPIKVLCKREAQKLEFKTQESQKENQTRNQNKTQKQKG